MRASERLPAYIHLTRGTSTTRTEKTLKDLYKNIEKFFKYGIGKCFLHKLESGVGLQWKLNHLYSGYVTYTDTFEAFQMISPSP